MAAATPKLTLYTNHGCPWAHRAHIALAELQLPYDEEIVDLTKPRTPEYLQVNPRGLVPSLRIGGGDGDGDGDGGGQVLTESAVVAGFLADAFPSHLTPTAAADDPVGAALARARLAFFVDAYISKVNGTQFRMGGQMAEDEREGLAGQLVDAVVKEVEPLLGNAAPFFNGSDKLTLAEVLVGPFVLRLLSLPHHGVYPRGILDDLSTRAPNFYRWAEAVSKHPSVNGIFDAEAVAKRQLQRSGRL
ncbi:glutathione S-transferase domain-containing protein [Xylariaceae sp. FL0804]|nr:glutathione S-transferase domain-containing protein [Xylariaceae sp. FL0804]